MLVGDNFSLRFDPEHGALGITTSAVGQERTGRVEFLQRVPFLHSADYWLAKGGSNFTDNTDGHQVDLTTWVMDIRP